MRTTEIIVAGSGAAGAAIAYHLALRGAAVTVAERRFPASGASGKSAAMVRMHYTYHPEAGLAWLALPTFERWADEIGGDVGFHQIGFVRCARQGDEDMLRQNVAALCSLGIETEVLGAAALRELWPGVVLPDETVAAWEPRSGYADPIAATALFRAAAVRHGATILDETSVIGVRQEQGGALTVRTSRGDIAASALVIAAGWGSQAIAASLGVDLPIVPFHIRLATYRWPVGVPNRHPVWVDGDLGFYIRPYGHDTALAGGIGKHVIDDAYDYDEGIDSGFIQAIRERVADRVPAIGRAVSRGGWAGVDVRTPDGHPLLGQLDGLEGIYVATGFSGTGFKIAPAVGRAMAELILDGSARSAPIEVFHPRRLERGEYLRGPYEYHDAHTAGSWNRMQPMQVG